MTLLLQLLWLAMPVILTGFVHLLVLKNDWLPALRRAPLDFGASWRGRRIFGANKTWRGAVIMIVCTAAFAAAIAQVNVHWLHWPVPVRFAQSHPAAWGALLGCGYIVGELPNSFAKRQFGIAPGSMGSGLRGKIFWVADQLDSLAGMLLFIAPFWQPPLPLVALLVAVMLVAHPVSAWVMVLAGLKDRVG
jgi:CDP-diglyceride synthetase